MVNVILVDFCTLYIEYLFNCYIYIHVIFDVVNPLGLENITRRSFGLFANRVFLCSRNNITCSSFRRETRSLSERKKVLSLS